MSPPLPSTSGPVRNLPSIARQVWESLVLALAMLVGVAPQAKAALMTAAIDFNVLLDAGVPFTASFVLQPGATKIQWSHQNPFFGSAGSDPQPASVDWVFDNMLTGASITTASGSYGGYNYGGSISANVLHFDMVGAGGYLDLPTATLEAAPGQYLSGVTMTFTAPVSVPMVFNYHGAYTYNDAYVAPPPVGVPESSSMALVGLALVIMYMYRRRLVVQRS